MKLDQSTSFLLEVFMNRDCQEKCLWAEIHSLYDPEKAGCYASNDYLCEFIGVKERRLQEMLANLKHLGWLVQVYFDGRNRIIKAVVPPEDFKPQVRAGQRCGKVHPSDAEKCTSEVQFSAVDSYNIDISRDSNIDTPICPQPEKVAKAPGARVSSLPKKAKKEEVSSDAKEFLPQFIKVIKDFKPTYVVKNEINILKSIQEMLMDGRKPEEILRVLAWAVKDNIIRGDWNGWSSKVICKNPAAYLNTKFEQIDTASKAKKDRKFAPSSDDEQALRNAQAMKEGAL